MRAKLYLIALLLTIAAPCFGQDAAPVRQPTGAAVDDADAPPSMELLEFLGEWEADDGEWVDPTTLDLMLLLGREYSDE